MLFQIQEQERKQNQKQKIKLSQILKNATESNLLGDGYHLYRVLGHLNDYHRASFKEIGSYLKTLGLLNK